MLLVPGKLRGHHRWLNTETVKALKANDMRDAGQGGFRSVVVAAGSRGVSQDEIARWGKVIKQAKVKIE
jgi:hypothetical protein